VAEQLESSSTTRTRIRTIRTAETEAGRITGREIRGTGDEYLRKMQDCRAGMGAAVLHFLSFL
jgi:hypothetical protein